MWIYEIIIIRFFESVLECLNLVLYKAMEPYLKYYAKTDLLFLIFTNLIKQSSELYIAKYHYNVKVKRYNGLHWDQISIWNILSTRVLFQKQKLALLKCYSIQLAYNDTSIGTLFIVIFINPNINLIMLK